MFGRRRQARHLAVDERAEQEYRDDVADRSAGGYDDEGYDGDEYDRFDQDGYDGEYEDADDGDAADAEEFGEPAGPYDVDEDVIPEDGTARLDLGSVRVPMPEGAQIQVELEPSGGLHAVHLVTSHARLTVSAYAAPRTGELWPDIGRELAGQLQHDGARVRREVGEWGTELVALVDDMLLRFIGVDGPRWMLRAVAAGPKEHSAQGAAELREVVRGTVVVRGRAPMPARTPLELRLPEEIQQHIQHNTN